MRSSTRQRCGSPSRLGALLLAVVGALILSAVPASAHNVLISSNPAAGSQLAHVPSSITLVFDQDVDNAYAEVAITVGSQAPVLFTPQIDGPDVTVDLTDEHLAIPAAPSGRTTWTIGYRIVSADGHPVSGLVNFSVGAAGAVKVATTTLHPVSSTPPWLLIVSICTLLAVIAAATVAVLRRRRKTAA